MAVSSTYLSNPAIKINGIDLTNQATLKVWSLHLTLIDLAWGTTLTSVSALGRRRAEIEAFVRSHQALRDQLLADRPDYERLVRAGLS